MVDESVDNLEIIVTDRAKELFSKGKGGHHLGHAQGYIGLLILSDEFTKEGKRIAYVELMPSYNEGDGKQVVKFEYEKEVFYVKSTQALGSQSGDAHTQSVVKFGLAHLSGVHGRVIGFGFWKGITHQICEARVNSYSQNTHAFVFSEEYLLAHYARQLITKRVLTRAIPSDFATIMMNEICKKLSLPKGQQQGIANFKLYNEGWEQEFKNYSEEQLCDKLIDNLYIASIFNDIETVERILALAHRFKNLSILPNHKIKLLSAIKAGEFKKIEKIMRKAFRKESNAIQGLIETVLETAVISEQKKLVTYSLNDDLHLTEATVFKILICAIRNELPDYAELIIKSKRTLINHTLTRGGLEVSEESLAKILYYFIKNDHLDLAELVLKSKLQYFLSSEGKENLLILVYKRKNFELLSLLLKNHADPLAINDQNESFFSLLVKDRHFDLMSELIKQGVLKPKYIYPASGRNISLLHEACSADNPEEIITFLLNHGADPNNQSASGYTPLMFAAANNLTKAVEFLLEHAALKKIDLRVSCLSSNALILAVKHERLEVIKLFLKHLDPIEFGDLIIDALAVAVDRMDDTIITLFLESISDINQLYAGCETLLTSFVLKEKINFISHLLKQGASINQPNANGQTALHLAVTQLVGSQRLAMINFLLEQGADTDIHSRTNGTTPLEAAILQGSLDVAKLLLEWKYPNDSELLSIFELGYEVILDTLMSRKIINEVNPEGNSLLFLASVSDNNEILGLLLKRGVDVNFVNRYGQTIMLIATCNKNLILMERLVQCGASVQATDQKGYTLLMHAISMRSPNVIEFLLDHGADVNSNNHLQPNITPLYLAARTKDKTILTTLLVRGAHNYFKDTADSSHLKLLSTFTPSIRKVLNKKGINLRDIAGNTQLIYAVRRNDLLQATQLLGQGANPNLPNYSLETAILIAVKNKHLAMLTLLLEKQDNFQSEFVYNISELIEIGKNNDKASADRVEQIISLKMVNRFKMRSREEDRRIKISLLDLAYIVGDQQIYHYLEAAIKSNQNSHIIPEHDLFDYNESAYTILINKLQGICNNHKIDPTSRKRLIINELDKALNGGLYLNDLDILYDLLLKISQYLQALKENKNAFFQSGDLNQEAINKIQTRAINRFKDKLLTDKQQKVINEIFEFGVENKTLQKTESFTC